MSLKVVKMLHVYMNVKQTGSRWEAELFGVLSEAKLFAYGTVAMIDGLGVTVLAIIKLTKFMVALRLRSGRVNWFFDIISSFLAKFKKVVHNLEPGETPSNSASHQAPNYVQRSSISQHTRKRCVAVAVRLLLFFQFTQNQLCTYIEKINFTKSLPHRMFLNLFCGTLERCTISRYGWDAE